MGFRWMFWRACRRLSSLLSSRRRATRPARTFVFLSGARNSQSTSTKITLASTRPGGRLTTTVSWLSGPAGVVTTNLAACTSRASKRFSLGSRMRKWGTTSSGSSRRGFASPKKKKSEKGQPSASVAEGCFLCCIYLIHSIFTSYFNTNCIWNWIIMSSFRRCYCYSSITWCYTSNSDCFLLWV